MHKKPCKVDECSRIVKALGYCESHYKRFKKYGDPLAGRIAIPRTGATRMDHFVAKVDYNGPPPEHLPELGPCHLWTAATSEKGYGVFYNERNQSAHTWLWEEVNGPLKPGYCPDHLCLVRHCVNLDHMEEVTIGENTLRGLSFSATNARKTHCKRGHALIPENCYDYEGVRQCKLCARIDARERYHQNKDVINARRRKLRALQRQ